MTLAGEFMNSRLILAIIAVGMILAGSAMLAYGEEIDIEIKTDDNVLSVVENIPIEAVSGDFLEFWIQDGATDISISINNDPIEYESLGNNKYSSNVSILYLIDDDILDTTISYNLDKDTTEFNKELLYNISKLSITYEGEEIFSGTNLKVGNTINVALQKQTEGQTITVESIPVWVYIIIVVLIILIIVALMRPAKKQKSKTKKESTGGSEELLSTRKSLLMEILKEIEKRHRGKQISDDTYHKLKGEFKQDAVETMKKLDDMK